MALMACRLMMGSGVLRPGTREIRRGQGGLPLYATRQIPELLESVIDMSFMPELKPSQRKIPDRGKQVKSYAPPSFQSTAPGSFRALLNRLSNLRPSVPAPMQEPNPKDKQLEKRLQALELLLKAERGLCRAQRDELIRLRARAKQVRTLEADLAIERESGKQLVQWLEKAETELARLRSFFDTMAAEHRSTPPPQL